MLALPATGLLDNILTGGKTLGSTIVEGAATATSAPTVAYNTDGAIEIVFAQNVAQAGVGATVIVDLTPLRTVFVLEILVIKTGGTGVAGDQVTISKGSLANSIASAAVSLNGVANGVVTRVATLVPQFQYLDPTTATGFFRLTVVGGAPAASDTRCIVIIRCLRANDI